MSLRKKMILIVLMCFFIFGYVVFSDTVNTRYTKFYFLSGGTSYKNITVDLVGGETGNVDFYLKNKSDTDFPVNMSFVDSEMVTFDSKSVRICKSEKKTGVFGQYVSMDNSSFSVGANTGIVKQLDLNFPEHYSGVYLGCVLYSPETNSGGNWNTFAREAIFLDVDVDFVSAAETSFEVRAYPSNRQSGKWGNYGKLFFYSGNRVTPLFNGVVDTNILATGTYRENIPTGIYDVVYKGHGELGSYLSGIQIIEGQLNILDFTTGSNLYTTKLEGNTQTQIAGDVLRDGKINVMDITSVAHSSCDYGGVVTQYHACNLNGDTLVSIGDVTVVASNVGSSGPFFTLSPEFGGFSR